ncbi:MAG TPA: transglutaminase family protein [Chryseolinea sp.]|nr:transglutaminase family protein [Chryseolinea sp.]
MKYKIKHVTEYAYQDPVGLCHNRLCLTPSNNLHQKCVSSEIKISPAPDSFLYRQDFFGNTVAFFSSYKDHDHLEITSISEVDLVGRRETDLAVASPILWQEARQHVAVDKDDYDIVQYTLPSGYIPISSEVKKFCDDCFVEDATLWSVCNTLMQKIHKTIEFKPGFTTVNTPVEEVLTNKKGVCQDFAHLMISCLRNMGLAARYVSGYIETIPPPGKEKLVGTDASHAWVSVFFPSIGWVEFDPTNSLLPSDNHVTVALGRDYHDVAPIKGIVFSSGKQSLTVKVDVIRVD